MSLFLLKTSVEESDKDFRQAAAVLQAYLIYLELRSWLLSVLPLINGDPPSRLLANPVTAIFDLTVLVGLTVRTLSDLPSDPRESEKRFTQVT